MTNGFASKTIRLAGSAVLACILATSVGAQNLLQVSLSQPQKPETMVLFFDVQSAALTSEAKTIVLNAVDTAERTHAKFIELAAYAAADESTRDPELMARRAAMVKQQIANYGFQGRVIIDDEAPDAPLVTLGDETIDRRAALRIGG